MRNYVRELLELTHPETQNPSFAAERWFTQSCASLSHPIVSATSGRQQNDSQY
jgi:hypothetical protein